MARIYVVQEKLNVAGWKARYIRAPLFVGRTANAWNSLPTTGATVFMLYFDERITPGGLRYRRIMHGTDFYFRYGNNQFGQADVEDGESNAEARAAILSKYPDAHIIEGGMSSNEEYETESRAAMADRRLSR